MRVKIQVHMEYGEKDEGLKFLNKLKFWLDRSNAMKIGDKYLVQATCESIVNFNVSGERMKRKVLEPIFKEIVEEDNVEAMKS